MRRHSHSTGDICQWPGTCGKTLERCLNAAQKLGNAHLERPGEHFEISDTDFLLPVLQIRNETPIHADVLGHVDLCPLPLLAEGPQPLAKPYTDISGHAPIMDVGFRR
jgi:hypothetical protein